MMTFVSHLLLRFGEQSVFSSCENNLFNIGYSVSGKLFFLLEMCFLFLVSDRMAINNSTNTENIYPYPIYSGLHNSNGFPWCSAEDWKCKYGNFYIIHLNEQLLPIFYYFRIRY